MRGDGDSFANCIHSQIVRLVWSAAWFRVVLRARELATADDSGDRILNAALHSWIDSVFLDSFLINVRRLAGAENDGLIGKHACYSLSALLRDLRTHQNLLTRENLLSLDNLSFDIALLRQREEEYWREHSREGKALFIPQHLDERRSEQRNIEIDRLCLTTADCRRLTDTVRETVFTDIESRLTRLASLSLYTNKFIAHAATAESRRADSRGNADELRIKISDLWLALEDLCRTVAALDGWLINRTAHAFLPSMFTHEWRGIAAPFVQAESVPVLRDFWKQLETEAMGWGVPSIAFVSGMRD
jgi:hypothetical protein